MFSDVKFAARLLLKHPGFTIVATLVLALGIGANTAIFSVVDAVLLRPLPFADQDRIVSIQNLWRNTGVRGQASAPDFHDWHDQTRSFDGTAAYVGGQTSVNVSGTADYAVVTRATPVFPSSASTRNSAGCRRLTSSATADLSPPSSAACSGRHGWAVTGPRSATGSRSHSAST